MYKSDNKGNDKKGVKRVSAANPPIDLTGLFFQKLDKYKPGGRQNKSSTYFEQK